MNSKLVRVLGAILMAVGALLVVAGGTTWVTVRSQLVAQHITIPQDAMAFQGNQVDGPLDAFVQADIIDHHTQEMTDGKTYAQMDREDPVRATVATSSFLRASLFTSVIAFGFAAFAAGIGALFGIVGLALRKLASPTAV